MPDSFFFYDLETSGISAARDRIMQFAGQRTDLDLKPIDEPVNILVRLSDDILPSAEAILISGLSPLQTQKEGITEAEFTEIFNQDIAKPGTIFTGFNNLRFDDEFIRYLNYRNFYDAYRWHWQDSSSRWDILDVVRMTRALRPEGINWPFNEEGKPSNKLEYLTTANNLKHDNAHDALSDTLATIDVARLIRDHQPKLFNYLLDHRKKPQLIQLIRDAEALVYTSSHYSSEFLHTTVVAVLDLNTETGTVLVYDLRQDAQDFLDLSIEELTDRWRYDPDSPKPRLPVKSMRLNRCPAIAPVSVLDEATITRLKLNMEDISRNRELVNGRKKEFALKLQKVAKELDKQREQRRAGQPRVPYADERLYDKFVAPSDAKLFETTREEASLASFEPNFSDKRLNELYTLYRARNYPGKLSGEEKDFWQAHVRTKLFEGETSEYVSFKTRLEELKKTTKDKSKIKLLNDLDKYVSSIASDYEADLPAVAA
ncbi:MAG TPA: exodeoxyribonuclease I [Candidatus Saccharimonadales bacterium]|jgi:exodeoxyribonuclease-1